MIKYTTNTKEIGEEIHNIDNRYIIVDFYTDNCPSCKLIDNQLDVLTDELGDDILIIKVNAINSFNLSEYYRIMSVPTLLYFNNGELVNQSVGYASVGMIKDNLFNR